MSSDRPNQQHYELEGPADGIGLLRGSKAIGEYIGISQRDVLNLVRRGELPAFVVGNAVRASPASLKAWVREQEEKALGKPLPPGALPEEEP